MDKIPTKQKAFSLIELLIAISIAAILSAVAFAQYQTFSIRAKISQAMVIINNIGEHAKTYYDIHGVFPNLQQIGLYYDPGDPTQSPMANSLSEYIGNYVPYTFLLDEGITYTCPSAGYGGYISNLAPGDFVTTGQDGSFVAVNLLVVYVNHTFKNYCQYYYLQFDPNTQSSAFVSGNIMPACSNGADDPNAGNFFLDAGNQC